MADKTKSEKVFKLDGTDNWVLKQYTNSQIVPASHKKASVVQVRDNAPEMNLGQSIAKVEIPVNPQYSSLYFVQKNQKGHIIGVEEDRVNNPVKSNRSAHIRSLYEVANMPQEAFNQLIVDIREVAKKGYDINAKDQKSIKVDPYQKKFLLSNVSDFGGFNGFNAPKDLKHSGEQYGDVLYTLVGGKYAIKYSKEKEFKSENDPARMLTNKIFHKYILAMSNNGCQFQKSENFDSLMKSNLFDNVLESRDFAVKVGNIKRLSGTRY